MLGLRYEQTGDIADLRKSGSSFCAPGSATTVSLFRRIQAAARAVNVLISLEDLQSALQLAQDAIDLLPAISNRSLQRADQQYAVSHFSGLAASACSLFLLRNQPEQALEVLEEDGLPFLANLSVTGATSQHWTTHIPMWLIGFKTFLLRLMPL
jgi:hypothetical protein